MPHPTRPPTRALSRALPRRRALCTNWKNPRYCGSSFCEMPRCGRSQERSSDQKPSMVLTCTSQNPSPPSSRGIFTIRVADRLMLIAPGWQPGIDVVFVGVDQRTGCNCLGDDRFDGCLLHIGQHGPDPTLILVANSDARSGGQL